MRWCARFAPINSDLPAPFLARHLERFGSAVWTVAGTTPIGTTATAIIAARKSRNDSRRSIARRERIGLYRGRRIVS